VRVECCIVSDGKGNETMATNEVRKVKVSILLSNVESLINRK